MHWNLGVMLVTAPQMGNALQEVYACGSKMVKAWYGHIGPGTVFLFGALGPADFGLLGRLTLAGWAG